MELASLEKSTNKDTGKETLPPVYSGRCKNWTIDETNILFDCIEECQTIRGSVGFSFKKTDYSLIERLFNEKVKDNVYDKKNIENRIKVMVRCFKICHELATLSGGWDEVQNRPIAASKAEYITMVQGKGENAKFLLTSSFPWYLKMVPMVGGQTARGERREVSFNMGDPSFPYPLLQGPVQVSEQGSSNEPEEFNNDADDCDAANQPRLGARSHRSYTRRGVAGQSSEGAYPASQRSGSKRKSTDESAGETTSRGRRYKEKYKCKQSAKARLADAVFEIAKSLRADADRADNALKEVKDCINKMRRLKISAVAQGFIVKEIEKFAGLRALILEWTETEIVDWLHANNVYGNQQHSRNKPDGYRAMLNNNIPRQGYPNYNQGGNNYSYHRNNI